MKTLLIDDIRTIPATYTARTYQDGIRKLSTESWDLLLLDHDLGCFDDTTGRELTGYDIVCWLEKNPNHLPKTTKLVTSNPVGRDRMNLVLKSLYKK
ncbi:cyclic-phosphate processing receiver domain-containing protein [Halobacteriovorax sp. RT-1-4]|uniref:cyclic-phosphate processing receiver domain-containing protein n=1 Tax=unclassified Halobacteriovorax TaxID=2639665 RepID=UPI00399B530D